jgi:hypothetical protein
LIRAREREKEVRKCVRRKEKKAHCDDFLVFSFRTSGKAKIFFYFFVICGKLCDAICTLRRRKNASDVVVFISVPNPCDARPRTTHGQQENKKTHA